MNTAAAGNLNPAASGDDSAMKLEGVASFMNVSTFVLKLRTSYLGFLRFLNF